MRGGAELRDTEIRLRGAADGTLRGVYQKEPAFDEVCQVATVSAQLLKDVKQSATQIISGIGIEVPSGLWRCNTNEQNSGRVSRLATGRTQEARGALDVCIGKLDAAEATPCHAALEIRPAISHDVWVIRLGCAPSAANKPRRYHSKREAQSFPASA